MARLSRLSLTNRMVLGTTAATAAAVVVLVLGLQVFLSNATDTETGRVLRSRADAAAATVRVVHGQVKVLDPPTNSLDRDIWVYDTRGVLLDGPSVAGTLARTVRELGRTQPKAFRSTQDFRFHTRPVKHSGIQVATVVAAVDLRPYESTERRALLLAIALGLAAVAAAGAASGVATHVALGRVRQMARRADDWREHDLSGRFARGDPHDEITELAATLDRMLDRIAEALGSERRLTDELAHELRTPLTVIRSEAQLALMRPEASEGPDAEAWQAVVDATHRMDGSITTLLDAARSRHDPDTQADLRDVVVEAARRSPTLEGVRTLAVADRHLVAAAPPLAVLAALAPLVENAVRHADSTVTLRIRPDGADVVVEVDDDGPGVTEEQAREIFAPGHTTSANGAGLGLALARRLAVSLGGDVTVLPGPRGVFRLVLPRGES